MRAISSGRDVWTHNVLVMCQGKRSAALGCQCHKVGLGSAGLVSCLHNSTFRSSAVCQALDGKLAAQPTAQSRAANKSARLDKLRLRPVVRACWLLLSGIPAQHVRCQDLEAEVRRHKQEEEKRKAEVLARFKVPVASNLPVRVLHRCSWSGPVRCHLAFPGAGHGGSAL